MLKNLLIGLILVTSLTSRAEDVVSLQKGQPAPFSGTLFTESKAQELRAELLEKDKQQILLESLREKQSIHKQIIELKDEQIEIYRVQNVKLERANQASDTVKMIYFGLGIILTGAAVYGAASLSQ